jgi:hypothetical protein
MGSNAPAWSRLAAELQLPLATQLPAAHCQLCQETLPVFVSDEMAGLAVDDLYPATAVHLDICPTCFQDYRELVGLAMSAFYDFEDKT